VPVADNPSDDGLKSLVRGSVSYHFEPLAKDIAGYARLNGILYRLSINRRAPERTVRRKRPHPSVSLRAPIVSFDIERFDLTSRPAKFSGNAQR
jgi:hypothetical protein